MTNPFVDDGGPLILHAMRSDPNADVMVIPTTPGYGKSGQAAHAVVDYVEALRAELRRLQEPPHPTAHVQGYCPMGCGQTLFIGAGREVTCGHLSCPRPDAAADILDDHETEHLVTFTPHDFTIKHPLRERLDDALLNCELHTYCHDLGGPPAAPGRYRAVWREPRWVWTAMPA
jgi:Family of unknown function (DUF6085)